MHVVQSKLIQIYSNLANAASLLWHAYKSLPSPSNQVNWAGESSFGEPFPLLETGTDTAQSGFYVLDKSSDKSQLILGPFQGKVACQTIPFGRGVCGAGAQDKQTQLVKNVDEFPGHIACDGDSKSEIVVPILDGEGKVAAIIDVDCAELDGFDEVDQKWLEDLSALLTRSCDW